MAGNKKLMDSTMNSNVYNKARKGYLENSAQIYCSWCAYHRSENYKGKWYGGLTKDKIKRPSWKLVSKNRNQWEDTNIKIEYNRFSSNIYYEIKFKRQNW